MTSPSSSIVRSSSIADTSTSSFGRARRRLSIGPSDCPPAISFAHPLPRRASSASATSRGRSYSKRGGLHAASALRHGLRASSAASRRRGVRGVSRDLDAEGSQGVVHRVEDRRRRRDRAALAHALDAELGVRRRRFEVDRCGCAALPWRRAGGSRPASRPAAGRCASYGLSSYIAVPMPCATPPIALALDHHRVDQRAAVLDDHVVEDLHMSGSGIDRHRDRMPRVAERAGVDLGLVAEVTSSPLPVDVRRQALGPHVPGPAMSANEHFTPSARRRAALKRHPSSRTPSRCAPMR